VESTAARDDRDEGRGPAAAAPDTGDDDDNDDADDEDACWRLNVSRAVASSLIS